MTFKELTGLGRLAVLIVFVSHCANENLLAYPLGHGFGQIGVMLFFMLSGFLISHLYLEREFSKTSILDYIGARAGRVLPLYFLIVILSLTLDGITDFIHFYEFSSPQSVIMTLGLVKSESVLWTIPVEVQYYIIFIGFWWLYQSKFKKLIPLYILVLTAPLLLFADQTIPRIVTSYTPIFFLGTCTPLLLKTARFRQIPEKFYAYAGIIFLCLLCLNLPAPRYDNGLTLPGYFRIWGDPLTIAITYGLFICALKQSISLSVLNTKIPQFLGKISYGFYLIHLPVLKSIEVENDYLKVVLVFVVTSAIATLSFKYFETPAKNFIRKKMRTSKKLQH